MTRHFLLLLGWLCIAIVAFGQQLPPAPVSALLRQAVPSPALKANHARWYRNSGNDLQRTFAALFWSYKRFVSSQDRPGCQFSPSCSEYAIGSIRKRGLVVGAMATFDRLSRCNGLSREQYPTDPANQRLEDKP